MKNYSDAIVQKGFSNTIQCSKIKHFEHFEENSEYLRLEPNSGSILLIFQCLP